MPSRTCTIAKSVHKMIGYISMKFRFNYELSGKIAKNALKKGLNIDLGIFY